MRKSSGGKKSAGRGPDEVESGVTYGQLILEAKAESAVEKMDELLTKRHARSYSNWLKQWAPKLSRSMSLPNTFFSDMIWWELHAARLWYIRDNEDAMDWFRNRISAEDRRDLCDFGRQAVSSGGKEAISIVLMTNEAIDRARSTKTAA